MPAPDTAESQEPCNKFICANVQLAMSESETRSTRNGVKKRLKRGLEMLKQD